MNVLQRLEDAISASLERGFGRLTRAPLQPIDIARRLEQAIEDQQIIASERTLVPDQFWVFVHPQDYAQLQPWAATLETDLCQHLVEQAAARGWVFLTSPYVRVNQGQDVPRRQVRVMAQMSPMSPPSASGVVPLEETSALPAVSAPADPAASPATQYELRSLDGAVAYPLSAQTIDIGRERDNDIILDATGVSRHHAQIRRRHSAFVVFDLRSANGTAINDQPVQESVLAPGDRISFGGVELVFAARPPAPHEPPTRPERSQHGN